MKLLIEVDDLKDKKAREKVPCECEHCGLEFLVPKNVVLRALKGQRAIKFCSVKCRKAAKPRISYEKHCKECKRLFVSSEKRQIYCSRTCSAQHTNKNREISPKADRICVCGKTYSWGARSCKNCHQDIKGFPKYLSWINGEFDGSTEEGWLSNTVKRFLLKQIGKCEQCGWNETNPRTKKKPLQTHHIDGDAKNNFRKNIILLCPNCHSLTENFGNGNLESARSNRYSNPY